MVSSLKFDKSGIIERAKALFSLLEKTMKLTLHEVAQVLGAKMILVFIPILHSTRSSSIVDSSQLATSLFPLKVRVTVMTLFLWLLKMAA